VPHPTCTGGLIAPRWETPSRTIPGCWQSTGVVAPSPKAQVPLLPSRPGAASPPRGCACNLDDLCLPARSQIELLPRRNASPEIGGATAHACQPPSPGSVNRGLFSPSLFLSITRLPRPDSDLRELAELQTCQPSAPMPGKAQFEKEKKKNNQPNLCRETIRLNPRVSTSSGMGKARCLLIIVSSAPADSRMLRENTLGL